ncbi:carbohydrate ABC transporter permease [soil metagenome]
MEIRTLFKHVGLILIAICMAIPFLWMLGTSIKPHHEVEDLSLLPKVAQPQNYSIVLRQSPDPYTGKFLDLDFPKWYFNSIFIASWVTVLQVLTSSMAAFAFSRLIWPGRDKVFFLYLGTMMIPGIVTMLPNYQVMVGLGMVNTYQGLIIPAAFSAFGTFLLRQFMIGIPRSYDEAAEIDGATHLQTFLEVILPMARPGLIALSIFTFLGNFQSFFWPLVMVKDDAMRTIPVGLLSFQGIYGQQTELIMAATVMNVLPLIILFVVMQRQLVSGIQLGGVKG